MGLGSAPILLFIGILLLAASAAWLVALVLWLVGWRTHRRWLKWVGGIPSVGIPACVLLVYIIVAWGFGPFHRVPDRLTVMVTKGMSKAQVLDILGEPNENENDALWGYYTKESGFFGIMSPIYVGFDGEDKVESVWCQ